MDVWKEVARYFATFLLLLGAVTLFLCPCPVLLACDNHHALFDVGVAGAIVTMACYHVFLAHES